jgi:dihydroorotate dehydrogenase
MSGIPIFRQALEHAAHGQFDAAGAVLRHEGLKRGFENGLYYMGYTAMGREILELAGDTATVNQSRLHTHAGDLQLTTPGGLAAGWDKTGRSILAWQTLGASHITVGGIPFFPQAGNPLPRLFTFDSKFGDHGTSRSLNRYGFYSPGAAIVADNIRKQRDTAEVHIPVIAQVTLNKEFYDGDRLDMVPRMIAETIRKVAPVADAISLGLSSPNTKGMRNAQDDYGFMLRTVRAARETTDLPLVYKGDGDGGEERLDSYCRLYEDTGLDGFEFINTTGLISIKKRYHAEGEAGGLAGADKEYQQMALDSVRYVRRQLGPNVIINGMGGINSGAAAADMLEAGATMYSVNTYVREGGLRTFTGLSRGLVEQMDARSYSHVEDFATSWPQPAND